MSVLAIAARACAMPILLLALLFLLKWSERAESRELYKGQYDNVDPKVQQWFRSQKVPNGPRQGQLCCSEADGVYVQEDIRNGHYWAKGGPFPEFVQVPDEVVIPTGNHNGAPLLWSIYQDGVPQIRCYAPGPLL
jgi:hypothetical protein